MIIFYYCTTNYRKFSSLKYHSFITHSSVDKKYRQACLTLLLRETQGQSLNISQAWILSGAPRKQVIFQTHFKCTLNFIYFLIGGKLLYNFVLVSAISSVQFSSVAQSCPTLCDCMNHSTPGLPVHHQLPDFTQTHVHQVSDAIQPSHPLLSPSPPAPNPSQHQGLFQ